MESNKIIPKGILFPFILLTTLFFAWAVPSNLTDTMLAAFKRSVLFVGIWMLCCSRCLVYQEIHL